MKKKKKSNHQGIREREKESISDMFQEGGGYCECINEF